LNIHHDGPRVVAEVDIPASESARRIRASIDVVIDGGKIEDSPPEGATVPQILEWQSSDGARVVGGPILTIHPGDPTQWFVHANYVEDAVVRFRLTEVEVGGARHAQ
jgi:hypothetical protein